jgi:VWFA-related protein
MDTKDTKLRKLLGFVFFVSFVSFVPSFLAAQEQPPVFKAGVELVRLDVRVTDAQGQPVRDLRQDEVEVVENGAARPVVFFQHVQEPSESYAEVASRTVASEVSTNQGAARGHLFVLVFDQVHIAPGGEQRARLAAQRFLQTRIRPGDRVALYALPGPGPQIGFTADTRRVIAELPKIRGMAEPQAIGAMGTMTLYEAFQILRRNEQILQRVTERNQALGTLSDSRIRVEASTFGTTPGALTNLFSENAQRIANVADGETRRVLASLSDVLRQMRTIEGRKSVLLVSEGFFGDRLPREIENVAAAAAESYSVVYSIDVNRHDLDITADEPVGADQANAIHDKLAPLGSLASETGGTLILDANRHADEAFASLADQTQDYYLIGFTPATDDARDRDAYRRVTIHVKRRDAQVSTRTGFTLTDTAARMDRRQAIDRAMAAPFSQQALPIQYTTYVMRGSAAGMQRVIMSLAAELPIAAPNQTSRADVAFVVRSAADGHVAASGQDSIALPTAHGAHATTGVGPYHVQFEVPAGEYVMRAVVREPGGLVGSADRRFVVRALDGPALTSGDLVLSAAPGELPVRPVAYTGDGLSGVLELHARTIDQLRDARVTVDLVPVGETHGIVSGSCELLELRTVTSGAAREARIELPLQGVAAGTYLVRARVASGGETATEVVREIEIRQGTRPVAADDMTSGAFDPRLIVNGALARQFITRLTNASSPVANTASLGLDRLSARDYPAAIAALQLVVDGDPTNADAAFLLGWAFHGAGDDRQAISAWRRAAFVEPTMIPAHLALAEMYVRLSQPALAIQALRAGLAAVPQSPELLDMLSRLERR